MSRLIDADKLKEAINSSLNTGRETFSPEIIYEVVDEQPTAFDVDKVIEKMEDRRANFDCKSCKYNFDDEKQICNEDCSDALIDGLIEIVKGGGVE